MTKRVNKSKNNFSSGVTLVESLVAIVILVIGVLGPLSIASRGISDGLFAQNRIVAVYLAQEGVDLVTGVIKHNLLAGESDPNIDWLRYLGDCHDGSNPNPCHLEIAGSGTSLNVYDCEADPNRCLLVSDRGSGGLYRTIDDVPDTDDYGSLVVTREISIRLLTIAGGTKEVAEVKARVEWYDKNRFQFLELVDYVYDSN